MYTEVCALKQGAPHAQLGALSLSLGFNSFLSHLAGGAPLTPRGSPFGGPPTPRELSYTGAPHTPRGPQETQGPPSFYPTITPEAAGAPTAAAAAAVEAPRLLTPRVWGGGPRGATLRRCPNGGASPQLRRAASVGYPRGGPPSPLYWEGAPQGAPEEAHEDDGLLLYSCRSTDGGDGGTQGGPQGGAQEGLQGGPQGGYFGGPRRAPSHVMGGGFEKLPSLGGPLRRPSPPPRVPTLAISSSSGYPLEGPPWGPPSLEAPKKQRQGGPPEQPVQYRELAAQARETAEEARRKMLQRRALGGPSS